MYTCTELLSAVITNQRTYRKLIMAIRITEVELQRTV